MAVFEYLFKYLQAAEPDLKTYLLSANVYWTLPVQPPAGMPPYPRFSLGWLLLYRRRLSAAETRPERQAVLAGIEAIHDQWRTAWAGKAAREFEVRLNQWTRFINEYRAEPAAHRSRYAYEVQRRTMLGLLRMDAGELPEEQVSLLAGLDSALRGNLLPGPFVQDPAYQPAFPETEFWFLYGELGKP
jgi:hypothetical protein